MFFAFSVARAVRGNLILAKIEKSVDGGYEMVSVIVRCGLRFAAGCIVVVSLSSCATGAAVLGVAYTVQTGRLPTDALASAMSDKNCDLIRQSEKGGTWCRDRGAEGERGASQPPVWCYRSLGEVSCYDRPVVEESAQLVQ